MTFAWKVNRMSSFSVAAIGYLAGNPQMHAGAQATHCRFCLTSQDYTEDNEQGRSTVVVQSIWFVATHLIGAAIAEARLAREVSSSSKVRSGGAIGQ
jgi:hypothetical protein